MSSCYKLLIFFKYLLTKLGLCLLFCSTIDCRSDYTQCDSNSISVQFEHLKHRVQLALHHCFPTTEKLEMVTKFYMSRVYPFVLSLELSCFHLRLLYQV